MAEINLTITADDQELHSALTRASSDLEKVDDDAAQLGETVDSSFSEGAEASKKLNKQLKQTEKEFSQTAKAVDKTGKQMDKTGKKTKSLTSKMRSTQRTLSLVKFAGVGIFAGILSQAGAAAEGINKLNGFLNPAVALQGRLSDAASSVAGGFVKQKSQLEKLLVTVKNGNGTTKEAVAARRALIAQFGDMIDGEARLALATGDETLARKQATEALIKDLAIRGQRAQLEKIFTELAEVEARTISIEAASQTTFGSVVDFVTQSASGVAGAITEITTGVETSFSGLQSAANQANKANLIAQAQNADKIKEGLTSSLTEVSSIIEKIFAESGDLTAEESGKIVDKFGKSIAKTAPILEGSLADLQKKLAEVNKEIQQQVVAGDKGGLAPLVKQAKEFESQIKAAEIAIKDLRGETEETEKQREARLKKQAELVIALTLDLEQRSIKQINAAGAARQQDIENTVKDAELKAKLLLASDRLLKEELKTAQEKFASEISSKELEAAQEQVEQNIALQEAQLRLSEAAATEALIKRGGTEEEATKLQQEQELARQRLTLESEKKRLELVLRFSKGRTAVEIEETKVLIAAINAELGQLGKDMGPDGDNGGKGKTLLELLGINLDDEQLQALKDAGAQILGFIEQNTQAQVDAANTAIAARDEEISNLSNQLERELQFREAGLASNVQGIRDSLNQEENLRQEALERRAAAQKTQFAIETATQAVNLITSSTEIIKAFSTIPFVGVALGIAAVGAMIAGFVSARTKAFQATKLAKGGKLKGKKHSDGGVPMSVDGQYTYEGEKGEWVTNSVDSADQGPLLEMINAGKFRGVDLLGLITGKNTTKNLRSNAVNLQTKEREHREHIQKKTMEDAIKTQTEKILGKLTLMYEKPQISATDTGYLKSKMYENGSIKIEKVKQQTGIFQ